MKTNTWTAIAGALALSVAVSGSAGAATTTIQAQDTGWYDINGLHPPANTNTFTGRAPAYESRGWFQFDGGGSAAATAISITFYAQGTLQTVTGTESIALFDYTGSVASLLAGTGGVAAFDDLGSGVQLGAHTISGADSSPMPAFTVMLSNDFVTQFNSSRGSGDPLIALGAALTSPYLNEQVQGFWSVSGWGPSAYLTVETSAVPEPATWAMMILGFGAAGTALRSRRRTLAAA